MRRLALAALLGLLPLTASAVPIQIVSFSQVGNTAEVTATESGGVTTIGIGGAQATVSAISPDASVAAPLLALVNLSATSIDAAVAFGSAVIQHFSGSFSITSALGGLNLLSGSFTDAAFGGAGGPGLVINVNNPPDALAFTSDVIPATDLQAPSSLNFAFTALTNPLTISENSIGSFGAAFVGNASASTVNTPEPASLGLLGIALVGLGMVGVYRRSFD